MSITKLAVGKCREKTFKTTNLDFFLKKNIKIGTNLPSKK